MASLAPHDLSEEELDVRLLAARARRAAAAARREGEPARAVAAAVDELAGGASGLFPSVFVLEHGRLWLVAERGYAVVPEGLPVELGIMGRAVRLGRPQEVQEVAADPDYVAILPGVRSEVCVPLRVGVDVAGALNVESERRLPQGAADALAPLAAALGQPVAALRAGAAPDLQALVRLLVHLSSLRTLDEIAGLAAASLSKVVPVEASQVALWEDGGGEDGGARLIASWRAEGTRAEPLRPHELAALRPSVGANVVCRRLDAGEGRGVVWLPLRVHGAELGVLAGIERPGAPEELERLDMAAILAAHCAAALDAALALERERRSALTDPLTEVLNRRGLDELLERAILDARRARSPLSVLVVDCDDFKRVNDRAGHAFGDALLREMAEALARALPEGAQAARLGGDEFAVVLPGVPGSRAREEASRIRELMREQLSAAGFPLGVSIGLASYPYDGADATALLRAADQALYAAKGAGKDCVTAFRSLARVSEPQDSSSQPASPPGWRRPEQVSVADVLAACRALEAEQTVEGVCERLCKSLVFAAGAAGCTVSRVIGEYLVDACSHALRDVRLGDEAAYRIADFPFTAEALRDGELRSVSFLDEEVDEAEAFLLRELGMSALLLVPLRVADRPWGLAEVYELRLRRFAEDEVAAACVLAREAERRLEALGGGGPGRRDLPVYLLPPSGSPLRGPTTR